GTSGHLGGGVLLAVLLGPAAGIITIASILIVQCLIFQDGGLLALGCNIINMGVVPCILGWWLYRTVSGRGDAVPAWRQYLAAWAACLFGVTIGAALVPIEAAFAGRFTIPVTQFLAVMVAVHLIIGAIEGLITFAVLAYLRQVRPACLGLGAAVGKVGLSRKAVAFSLVITALLLAGVVSSFASSYPDGLEWSYLDHEYGDAQSAIKPPSDAIVAVDDVQAKYAPLPDYSARPAPLGTIAAEPTDVEATAADAWPNVNGWGSLGGVIGTIGTLVIVYIVAVLLGRKRKMPDHETQRV
ncbi:MAG: energy-coupling factor ABC transporter permease, partial [Phycisphaerae bacterium]|nr:energy-coupling factor ABC transporter permease [Phycisphaerae bacterium]